MISAARGQHAPHAATFLTLSVEVRSTIALSYAIDISGRPASSQGGARDLDRSGPGVGVRAEVSVREHQQGWPEAPSHSVVPRPPIAFSLCRHRLTRGKPEKSLSKYLRFARWSPISTRRNRQTCITHFVV